MGNKFEGGGFPAKHEQPKKLPEESFADVSKELGLEEKPPAKEEKPHGEQTPGSIEEALKRAAEARPETKQLTARQKELQEEIEERTAKKTEFEARRAELADALKAGFGKDLETAKPRNWFFGMFDNFNKILKEYEDLKEEMQINERELKDARWELRDPAGYKKTSETLYDSTMRSANRAAGRESGTTKGTTNMPG